MQDNPVLISNCVSQYAHKPYNNDKNVGKQLDVPIPNNKLRFLARYHRYMRIQNIPATTQ